MIRSASAIAAFLACAAPSLAATRSTITLRPGEEITLTPNRTTRVRCSENGNGGGNHLVCRCVQSTSEGFPTSKYAVYHEQLGHLTDADYQSISACNQAITRDFRDDCYE